LRTRLIDIRTDLGHAKCGRPRRFSYLFSARIQYLTTEFPKQQNREFLNPDQGIFFEEQGNLVSRSRGRFLGTLVLRRAGRDLFSPGMPAPR
jgi:hypothetical protein